MKKLLIVTLIFTNFLFANSISTSNNSGKIDMHGGKGENLLSEKNSLSNKDINQIGILKPIPPVQPKEPTNLIKHEKQIKKEIKK